MCGSKSTFVFILLLFKCYSLIEDLYPVSNKAEIRLLFADDDLLVFDKPANLNTAPGFLPAPSLAAYAAEVFGIERIDQMIAHRLDYGTSGVVVFARNVDALTELHRQFRLKYGISKKYVAVVSGILPALEGVIDLPIGKDRVRGPPYFCVDPEVGKPCLTYWHALSIGKKCALLALRPVTGRTHQLRIHLAAIGLPIVGDKFYSENHKDCSRLLLHAETLNILHPRSGIPMQFRAPHLFKDLIY